MAGNPEGGFGSTLRNAREGRGLSLPQIAKATKIPLAALEALERNDISRLPGGIFSRAFVRAYAMQVGLDPEAAIDAFLAQFPQDSVTAGHPIASGADDNIAIQSDQRMASALLKLVLISIPIAGALLYLSAVGRPARDESPLGEPPPVTPLPVSPSTAVPSASLTQAPVAPAAALTPTPPPSTAAPPPKASPPSQSVSEAAPPVNAPPAATSVPPNPGASTPDRSDRLTVSISATGPCWISATVDGGRPIERLLEAGDAQVLEVRGDLVLVAGDPAALIVTLNGAQARVLGRAGQTTRTRITLDNFKELLTVP